MEKHTDNSTIMEKERNRLMKIAVMGTGGVGGFFGGLLARSGLDVTFIARGQHLNAIQCNGLTVKSDLEGDFTVRSRATDDAGAVGSVDLVIYAVKMYHNPAALAAMKPLVGEHTVVLTLQNGIENASLLEISLGKNHVMVGAASVQAFIEQPGIISQKGNLGKITFGEIADGITTRGEKLRQVFASGGWTVELTPKALRAIWTKFIFLTGSAEINAITQMTYGEMRTTMETRQLIFEAWSEIISIAQEKKVDLGNNTVELCEKALDGFPAHGMSSLANDLRNGRQMELEGLTGSVVRMGAEIGVATPIHRTFYSLLKPVAKRIEDSLGQDCQDETTVRI